MFEALSFISHQRVVRDIAIIKAKHTQTIAYRC